MRSVWRIVRWTGAALLLLVALLAARLLWPVYTPSIGGENSIAELATMTIGGVEQQLLIRGRDRSNPVLLRLHGGPGSSEMVFNRLHRELEEHYVVVTWDQRGAGKSYDGNLDAASMNVEQFVQDTNELAAKLKERFEQDSIYLMGYSWGTVPGIKAIQQQPEHYAAYIAVSQVVNFEQNEALGYAHLVEQAEQDQDEERLDKLAELGRPPYRTLEQMEPFMLLVQEAGGSVHSPMPNSLLTLLKATELGWTDIVNMDKGARFSLDAMLDQVRAVKLDEESAEVDVPVYMIAGQHDLQANPALAEAYFAKLKAPLKKLYLFDNSAHAPQYEEPERFIELLTEEILPEVERGR